MLIKTVNNLYFYNSYDNKVVKIPYEYQHLPSESIKNLLLDKQIIEIDNFLFDAPSISTAESPDYVTANLIINVTDVCNLRCSYCAYSGEYPLERVHGKKIIDQETVQKALDDYFLKSKDYYKVSIYGGEPSVAREIIQFIFSYSRKKAQGKRLEFSLNTNAYHLTDALIESFIQNDVELHVSVDGPKEIHDKYRVNIKGKGTFDRVIVNLTKIRKLDSEYYSRKVSFIATLAPPYRIDLLKSLYESSDLFRRQRWFVNYVNPLNTNFFNDIPFSLDDSLRQHNKDISKLADEYIESLVRGNIYHFGHWFFGDLIKKVHHREMNPSRTVWINGSCTPGMDKLFVDTNGNYYPCERSGDFMYMGDVTIGVQQGYVYDVINRYRENCESGYCSTCVNARFCDTCYLAARSANGLDFSQKYNYCHKKIDKLKSALYIYCSVMEQNSKALDFFDEDALKRKNGAPQR